MHSSYLKWVGSKAKIINHVVEAIGDVDGTFYDVFGGSGTVTLNVKAKHRVLNDLNVDLINCHKEVISDWKPMSFKLQEMSEDYMAIIDPDSKTQHKMRKEWFEHNLRDIYNLLSSGSQLKSQLFLCLNRLCFNGLYRVNLDGIYNVGVGSYKTVYVPNTELKHFHNTMQDVELTTMDFEMCIARAKRGDTVYIDPPYLKDNTSMTDFSYCEGGFTVDDHIRLAECCEKAAARGVRVVVSNADVPLARKLYKTATKLSRIYAQRSVSCKGDKREKAKEIIAVWYGDEVFGKVA